MMSHLPISKQGWKLSEQPFMQKTRIYFRAEINIKTANFKLAAKSEIE